jgi:succinoglycan biosynthesis protein ExoM
MPDGYLIAIASYRRPSGLRQLLDSLSAEIEVADVDVLVVDNDPEGSARQVATNHPVNPTYVVEPEPGIATARNRALQHFSDAHRAIIFVDDDEWVGPNWLTTLITFATRTGADVVQGSVVGVLPRDAPPWVSRGGFIQRHHPVSGQQLPSAATNNTLLRRDAWLRAGSPRFDPSFSMTGGSDADFFWGIRKSGSSIRFCAEAIVYEVVPADRLSLRWVRRRAIRNGIAETRLRRKHRDLTVAWLAKSVVRSGHGLVGLGIGLAAGRGLQARPFDNLFRGYGRVAALANYRILEYARPPRHDIVP